MISKQTARKMYEYYTKRIDTLISAQEALTDGGVKSYTIGDRSVTKFDLDSLSKELDNAVKKQAYYDAILHGKPERGISTIVPNDK